MVHGRIEPSPTEQLVELRRSRDRYAALADRLHDSADPDLDPAEMLAREQNARRIAHAYEKSISNSVVRMSSMDETHRFALPSLGMRTWLMIFVGISLLEGGILLAHFQPQIFRLPLLQAGAVKTERVADRTLNHTVAAPVLPKLAAPPAAPLQSAPAPPKSAPAPVIPPVISTAPRPGPATQSAIAPLKPAAPQIAPIPKAVAPPPQAPARATPSPTTPTPTTSAPKTSARATPVPAPSVPAPTAPAPSTPAPSVPVPSARPTSGPVIPVTPAPPAPVTQPAPAAPVAQSPPPVVTVPVTQSPLPPVAAAPSPPASAQLSTAAPSLTRPEAIAGTHTLPPYPVEAKRLGEAGKTQMKVEISPQGTASECTVAISSGSARLDAAACSYVEERWRWKPATRDGQPVATTTAVTVVWSLQSAR